MDRSENNETPHDIPEDTSLGALLRKAREERQIDLDEAVRATRVTRQNLEALENEEWSRLPSEVFVKGFLRSYAGFLGLDTEMVLNYYLKVSPSQHYRPHRLEEISLQPRRWQLIILIPLLALGLLGSVVYLRGKNISVIEKAFQYLVAQTRVEEKEYAVEQEAGSIQQDTLPADEKVTEEQVPPLMPETVGQAEEREDSVYLEEAREAEEQEQLTAVLSEPGGEPETPAMVRETEEAEPPTPHYTLTARVISRTWIAIYIDDEPVKEYLFQPGDTMKWTGDKGFDILVGNAGGIEFSLNGKDVGHLGPEGKVVRLKLPEGT